MRMTNWALSILIAFLSVKDGGDAVAGPVEQPPRFVDRLLSACSAVPYPNEVVIVDLAGTEIQAILLPAGYCADFRVRLPADGALLYTRAIRSSPLARLEKYTFFQEAWRGLPIFAPGNSGVWACVETTAGTIQDAQHQSSCTGSQRTIELGFLAPDASRYSLFLEDPYICAVLRPSCGETNGMALVDWAGKLSRSLEISLRAWTVSDQRYGLIPTATGLETTDSNGPFTLGILVVEQQSPFTPLGSAVPAREGDVLVAFNGEPIFDRDDFIMLVIEHGATMGYEKPYRLEIERAGKRYATEGYLVFHRAIYGDFFLAEDGSCKHPTSAMLSLALQEATFFTKPILACVDVDRENMSIARQRECEFAVRQLTAAYQQYCPSLARAGAIVGSVFMPGRAQTETAVRSLAVKSLSRGAAAALVEVVEEVARAVITLPPGVSAEGNWGSIGQQVGFGMAIGSGVRLLTLR